MAQEYPDKRVSEEVEDSDQDSRSAPFGVSRRYWGDASPKAAPLPHWTEPPTGEIPKIFGMSESDRRAGHLHAPEETDEGAISFQRERRRLEYDDKLGTVDHDHGGGRHFAAEDDEPEPEERGFSTEEMSVPSEPAGNLRVISSRPAPQSLRRGGSRRLFKAGADSEEPEPEPIEDVELDLPERRRPSLKRRPSPRESAPEEERPPRAPRRESAPRREGGRSGGSFATRMITGVVLGLIVIGAFKVGQPAVLVLLGVALVLAASEFYQLVRREHPGSPRGGYRPAVAVGLIGVVGAVAGGYLKGPSAMALVLTFTILASFLWYLLGVLKAPILPNTAVTFMGVAWIGLGGSYVAAIIRPVAGDPRRGLAYMMAVLITVVAGDVFAYFGGSLLGKRKLAPSVSPGKTVEGLVIGAIGAILAGAVIASRIHPVTVSLGAAIGILAALGGPCGDLVESKIKREIGAKDAGSILPGHGGFLDRVDALIFVTPLVYYLLYFTHHIA
ncbi:MAG: phosphatidate cytidylyltransferase [Actinomycetota bacterium]|nr:phosphatidate cytidylyltransferase [Actinomycetota bacterium]MDA8209247.1 phosphatidate cytidylyltransferase [Actinomycetota bacterium]